MNNNVLIQTLENLSVALEVRKGDVIECDLEELAARSPLQNT